MKIFSPLAVFIMLTACASHGDLPGRLQMLKDFRSANPGCETVAEEHEKSGPDRIKITRYMLCGNSDLGMPTTLYYQRSGDGYWRLVKGS